LFSRKGHGMNEPDPWISAAQRATAASAPPDPETPSDPVTSTDHVDDRAAAEHMTGAAQPQAGVEAPGPGEGLPTRVVRPSAGLWLVGAHGGAGESSLARLVHGWAAAERSWPASASPEGACPCVLVARTHAYGLRAAQTALRQWASGALGDHTRLLGLVLMPDAPGRLPRPLRELSAHVAGGAPRSWHFPWIEEWRTGEALDVDRLARPARLVVADLVHLSIPPADRPN
jgi:hypothetical protein